MSSGRERGNFSKIAGIYRYLMVNTGSLLLLGEKKLKMTNRII